MPMAQLMETIAQVPGVDAVARGHVDPVDRRRAGVSP